VKTRTHNRMEIAEENSRSVGIPLMLDPVFMGDEGMPVFYASVHGVRYYGKTPQEVERALRGLEPKSVKRARGTRRASKVRSDILSGGPEVTAGWLRGRKSAAENGWNDPWEQKRRAQEAWKARMENESYMNVPFLSMLGLPKEMNTMRVRRRNTVRNRRKSVANERKELKVTERGRSRKSK